MCWTVELKLNLGAHSSRDRLRTVPQVSILSYCYNLERGRGRLRMAEALQEQ